MRTPAGKECRYFYGDYYRGRQHEECRLLAAATPPQAWTPNLCTDCPVPEILLANACPHMVLVPEITRPFPFLRRQVRVQAHCNQSGRPVAEPQIGCGQCHQLPAVFTGDPRDADTAP